MKTGSTISNYRILDRLGRGGMGIVYKAEDTKLDRIVALKMLPAQALASEDDRARFYREAKAAAALHHPNIATIFGIDEAAPPSDGAIPTPGGTSGRSATDSSGDLIPFIAMEFVEGETLAERVKQGPLPLRDAVSVATQIAGGLKAAHDKGIVHRDIKSGNVMLREDGRAKILDFGLAMTAASTRLTQLGSTLGTAAYMSPEQARGEEVDHRADLWSLGVVLYEMISGRVPFPGDYEQAIVYGILNAEAEPVTGLRTGVPMDLERIVTKLLAKDRTRRYQTAADLIVDLESTEVTPTISSSAGVKVSAVAPTYAEAPVRARDKRAWIWPAVTVAACLVAALAWMIRPEAERPVRKYQIPVEVTGGAEIAPDGSRIALAAGGALWLRDLSALDFRKLVDSVGVQSPFWSPDGNQIGYFAAGSLYRIPSTGGAPTMISDVPFGDFGSGVWLENGSIYFRTYSGAALSEIYSVSDRGGNPRLFLRSTDDAGVYGYRDIGRGRYRNTIFVSVIRIGDGEMSEIVSLTPEGDRTTIFKTESQVTHPLYSPTGHVLYVINRVVWAVPVDRSGQSGVPFRVVADADGLSISDNGNLLYQSAATHLEETNRVPSPSGLAPGNDLVWVDRSGNVEGVIGVIGDNSSDPLSTPDGSRIVAQDADGLWLYAGDRNARTRLDLGERRAFNPTWFPGSNELAVGVYGGGSGDLSVLDMSGPGRMYDLVATEEPEFHADFSPDGKYVVFYRIHPESNRDIMLAEVRRTGDSLRIEGEVVPLIQTRYDEAYPEISPGGRFLAYHANRTGRWEIYMSLFPEGSPEWPVSANGGRLPRWSPDGDELFYVDFSGNLMSVQVDGNGDEPVMGEPVVLFNGEAFGHNLSATTLHNALYGVGPSGDRFIVVRYAQTSDLEAVTVVENWYAEFERE
jgi:serine/threonine-protein kinase